MGARRAASSDPVSQGQEGVAAALAACKILREMSHLEAGAEGGRSGSEAKYEQLALGEPPAWRGAAGLWAGPWAHTGSCYPSGRLG